MDCCADKKCCAVSRKNSAAAFQPLLQDAKQQQAIGFVSVSVIDSNGPVSFATAPRLIAFDRPHSPPPLAANCARLI